VNLDTNCTERLSGCVFDRSDKGVGRGVECQDKSRSAPRLIPCICGTDVLTRLFSLFVVPGLTMLALALTAFIVLTTALGTRMFATAFGTRVFTGSLGTSLLRGRVGTRLLGLCFGARTFAGGTRGHSKRHRRNGNYS
jgi:hypothetical protein